MNFDHLRTTYFEESAELLESAYSHLAALSENRADDDTVHALFRAIHSIKGGGGAFGFDRLVALAHVMETLLDLLRDGALAFDAQLTGLLLRGTDMLADLVAAERDGNTLPPGVEAELANAFGQAASKGGAPQEIKASVAALPSVPTEAASGWHIHFRPHPALFRNANEPLLLVRELRRMGPVTTVVDLSQLPTLDLLEPEDAYITWNFTLEAAVPRAKVEDVFEFVADDCDLAIVPIAEAVFAGDASEITEEHSPALVQQRAVSRTDTPAAQSVRVDVGKVDRLVNLVGELVINQAMLVQLGGQLPPDLCPGLIAGLETLSQHLRELQDGVMAIRTQPVRSVFARMPRLVRELTAQLGKEARLIITGEATEIDKNVVEQLADPLTHLLRNALDHGIEPPDTREAAGKPRVGTIHLSAEQRSSRIVIELNDDGRGIDRARVLDRAKERGLIAPDAVLTDTEIDELIFLPSFSTASVVSAVSGRGVGMDVVRRNIQALGGRIAVESRFGSGSRFLLSLPLTLAVMDGLVVSVGADSFILPISAIVESLRPAAADIQNLPDRRAVLCIRGGYVPLLPLHQRLGVRGAVTDFSRAIVVIVESDHGGRLGLVVDDLVGQQQVVVKSLDANYGPIDGIGGATILGDGRVALILDIPSLAAGGNVPPSDPQPAFETSASLH